jgi:hypothetical protein
MESMRKKFEKMFGNSKLKHLSLHPLFKSSVLKKVWEGPGGLKNRAVC